MDNETEADQLRLTLVHLGISQRSLAEYMGVTEETVSRWANGRLQVPKYIWTYLNTLSRIKSAFGLMDVAWPSETCLACGQPVKARPKTNAERQRAYRERRAHA